jgi:hypothetical protein
MKQLIKDLREWRAEYSIALSMSRKECLKAFDNILSRAKSRAEQEPLAVLANRKGHSVRGIYKITAGWCLQLDICSTYEPCKQFIADTYAEAEDKAREFLNARPDVKEGA